MVLFFLWLEKLPSHCPGQVDFHFGRVRFHSHLPEGQGIWQVICWLEYLQYLRATCPKSKLEFKFFSSPVVVFVGSLIGIDLVV